MSVNPRLSGFWEDSRRMSGYFERGDEQEAEGLVAGEDEDAESATSSHDTYSFFGGSAVGTPYVDRPRQRRK